jgi:plasmid stabilization system protein ParE
MKYNVKILDRAANDADEIYGWLAKRSPQGAWHWYEAYLAAADSLSQEPARHPLAPELLASTRKVHELHFKTRRGRRYRMLFVIIGAEVRVVSIRGHGQPPVIDSDLG